MPVENGYETLVCPNGLHVNILRNKTDVVTFRFSVLVGFQNEGDPREAEFCHANEHMAAKYTSTNNKSAAKVTEKLNQLGVLSNASTSIDETSYYMTGPKSSATAMADLFADAFVSPRYDHSIFKNEMLAVQNELSNIMASAWYNYDNEQARILYPGTPLGRSEKERIENVQRLIDRGSDGMEELFDWRRTVYHPARCVVFLTGGLTTTLCRKLVKRLGRMAIPSASGTPAPSAQVDRALLAKAAGEVHQLSNSATGEDFHRLTLVYSSDITSHDFDKTAALQCAESVLGRGLSSRLYQALRGTDGLVYAVTCSFSSHPCHNLPSFLVIEVKFQTHAKYKTAHKTCEEILSRISKVVRVFKTHGPTETEMKTWRKQLEVTSEYFPSVQKALQNAMLTDKYESFMRPQLLYRCITSQNPEYVGCSSEPTHRVVLPSEFNTLKQKISARTCKEVFREVVSTCPIIMRSKSTTKK